MVKQNYDADFSDISDNTADFRETDKFIEFTAKVLAAVGKFKNGATYRQLNGHFPNQGNWLNEAIESPERSGKIRAAAACQ